LKDVVVCSCGHLPKRNDKIRDISVQITSLELGFFSPIRFNTRHTTHGCVKYVLMHNCT